MEGEIYNFIMVWTLVLLSTSYCYHVAHIVPKGSTRFFANLPVVCLFLYLPLNLNSIHLGLTSAFYIAWLANFKILLFSFGSGPLSDPTMSLSEFIVLASLPIKAQQRNTKNNKNPTPQNSSCVQKYNWYYRKHAIVLAFIILLDINKQYIPKLVMQVIYCVYTYLGMEAILGLAGRLAKRWLDLDLEPPFNDPYLSSSLQDFWGRRWNKMSSSILRAAVYDPVNYYSNRVMGQNWARVSALMCTFLVSGLMHELLMFYVGRVRPVWWYTRFFLMQGLCLIVEAGVMGKFPATRRVSRVIKGPIVFGFVIMMYIWLVRPQLMELKTDARGVEEYVAVGRFFMGLGRASKRRLIFTNS